MTNDEFLSKYLFKELTEDVLAECEHFSCGVNDFSQSPVSATPKKKYWQG